MKDLKNYKKGTILKATVYMSITIMLGIISVFKFMSLLPFISEATTFNQYIKNVIIFLILITLTYIGYKIILKDKEIKLFISDLFKSADE